MNKYEYMLVDGTTKTIEADYYIKDSVDYVFYVDYGKGIVKDVYRIPVGWLVWLKENGKRII